MNFVSKSFVILAGLSLAACSSMPEEDIAVAPTVAGSIQEESSMESDYSSVNVEPTDIGEDTSMVKPVASSEELRELMKAAVGNNTVYFGFDSSALNSDSQLTLRKMANFMRSTGVNNLTIEGHCDERGTREYNLALGDRRAVAVKKFLVGLGVDPRVITTVSFGKERPVNMSHNADAWEENRRAVLVIN